MDTLDKKKLLSLPDELLEDIFSYLHTYDLFSILILCRRLYQLARPLLYVSPLLFMARRSGLLDEWESDTATVTQFQRSLEMQHGMYEKVRKIETDIDDNEHLPKLLTRMSCLKTLILRKHSWVNFHGPPNSSDFMKGLFKSATLKMDPAHRKLSSLRTLHLELYDHSRYWDIRWKACVFIMPELRHLILEGMGPDPQSHPMDRNFDLGPYYASTSLETLRFEECDIYLEDLKWFLKYPRKLRHISIRDVPGKRGKGLHNNLRPEAIFYALRPQASSLETIMIQLGNKRLPVLNLVSFSALTEIEIDLPYHEAWTPGISPFSFTLEHLVVWHKCWGSVHQLQCLSYLFDNPEIYFPQLKLLTVVFEDDDCDDSDKLVLPDHFQQALLRSNIECHVRIGNRTNGTVGKHILLHRPAPAHNSHYILPESKRYMDFEPTVKNLEWRSSFDGNGKFCTQYQTSQHSSTCYGYNWLSPQDAPPKLRNILQ
ncbi:MAG: hypothetical protein Q9227_003203 [Pyrenula ochraceoflavens]